MIDLKVKTLLQVHESNSFSKAAEILNLTQPAVSQQVKALEEELNIKIFNRGEKILKLTAEGEIVIKYAKRMNMLSENLNQALVDEKKHIKHLTVGVTPTVETNIMLSVFAKYCNFEKSVHIKIISDSIKNLYSMLKTYEIDVAIIEGKMNDNNFNTVLLDTDFLALLISYENPLSKKNFVTLNELKRENLILRLPNSGTRTLFESHLRSNNFSLDQFNVTMEIDNVEMIKKLVTQNFGVSILGKSGCKSEIFNKKFKAIPIENLSMMREVNMVYHKDFEHLETIKQITKLYFDSIHNNSL